MRAPDAYFHEVLYRTLLDLGAISDLLSMETPFLEGYLKKFGGLHNVSAPGGPLLPLNPSQVAQASSFMLLSACRCVALSSANLLQHPLACGHLLQLRGRRRLWPPC